MNGLISKTIGECLSKRAKESPISVGMGYRDETYTWKEMDEISDFLALRFMDMGIGRGTHAAIWSVNSPGWVLTYFAIVKLGAVAVLINTCYKAGELKDVLTENDVEYLFYGRSCKSVVYSEILDAIPISSLKNIRRITLLERESGDRWFRRRDFPESMSQEDSARLNEAKGRVDPGDLSSILFTSGTTSRPKGVMLSHYSLVNNSAELTRQMRWNEGDKICISVPLFHCFGVTAGILAGMHAGATLHLLKYYRTLDVMEQVEKYKCTVINGVPTIFLALIRNDRRKDYDLSSLRSGIIAGSPITPEEYLNICRELSMERLQVSYGQTETSPCVTISDYDDSLEVKSVTAGIKIPNIELRIWNARDNREASVGEGGEIQTRGYLVMMGYYNRPAETEKALDKEGWLHTGDLGRLDENGYLHVTGRMKEMIIRGGENISPLEIEECLIQMEGVGRVKVIGVAAAVLQEEIVACIVQKDGAMLEQEQVKAFVGERLANYKVPKYVLFFQEFPESSSGKIKLGELKKLAEDKIKGKDKEE